MNIEKTEETYLFDPFFMVTFAYRTSIIAGSSFMYSIPATSTVSGLPPAIAL